jgi:hypothetical protein
MFVWTLVFLFLDVCAGKEYAKTDQLLTMEENMARFGEVYLDDKDQEVHVFSTDGVNVYCHNPAGKSDSETKLVIPIEIFQNKYRLMSKKNTNCAACKLNFHTAK